MTDLSLANGGERESELGLKFVTFVVEVLKLVYIYIYKIINDLSEKLEKYYQLMNARYSFKIYIFIRIRKWDVHKSKL